MESYINAVTLGTNTPFSADDEVQVQAVSLYCQAYFGYGDEKAEKRYQQQLQRIGLRKIKNINKGDS